MEISAGYAWVGHCATVVIPWASLPGRSFHSHALNVYSCFKKAKHPLRTIKYNLYGKSIFSNINT